MSTALWKAVESANLVGLQAAIDAGASIEAIDESNRDKDSVLGTLCKSQSGEMSKKEVAAALWMIERGADVNHVNNDGATPLHHAVASGSHAVIDALISHGARAIKDKFGNSLLHGAVFSEDKDRWIWDRVIELGCGLDDVNNQGCTPLHEAVSGDNLVAAKYLLGRGADRSVRDRRGKTALQTAETMDSAKMQKLLK